MAITSSVCNSYKKECMEGTHSSSDTYKIALFTSSATLDEDTTAYSSTNEAAGTGYSAGGKTLSGFSASLDGSVAVLDFSDPTWTTASFTARGALIYNSSKSNKAVAVFDFGGNITSSGGNFTIPFPTANGTTGLIRLE